MLTETQKEKIDTIIVMLKRLEDEANSFSDDVDHNCLKKQFGESEENIPYGMWNKMNMLRLAVSNIASAREELEFVRSIKE